MAPGAGGADVVAIVPHTHWDREWYLPFEGFRERLVQMLDTLIPLLEGGFPHFHLDGQTAPIHDYLEVRPERRGEIERLVTEGRLSCGPWFTQMDEFLVSGESLIRNLEAGLADAEAFGAGRRDAIGYLPDQFGHVGQMPQLLRRAGIDRAVVWRGVPRAIEQSAFRWEAPDGSRVLAEYLPYGYFFGFHLRDARDPEALAVALRSAVEALAPFAADARYLIMGGADHSGPDPGLGERAAAASRVAPDLRARVTSLASHLDGSGPPERAAVWRGELRSAARAHLLANVVSNRVHQKRERARVEALVERYAEPLAALVPDQVWPAERLARAWRLLLWNGAHDSVCGCSVDEVAAAVDGRLAEARAIAEDVAAGALAALGAAVSEAGILRFNPSPFEREGVPGLGWRVAPGGAGTAGSTRLLPEPEDPEPVETSVAEGRLWVDGVPVWLRDEPDVGDLYTFCPSGEAAGDPAGPSLRAEGGTAEAAFDGLVVRLRAGRRPGEPFVRLEGEIENRRPDHRLRLHVGLPEPAAGSLAGSPFELVERGLRSEGGAGEPPSPTWPARGVVMAGGLALLAEGVLEYEVVPGPDDPSLAVTLLRCVGTISRGGLATRPQHAGPDVATPGAQMIGTTRFSLAVLPRASRAGLLPAWERFALPLAAGPAAGGGPLAAAGSLLEVRNAELSAVRRLGPAGPVEVRVWNPSPEPRRARVGGRAVDLRPATIADVVIDR